METKSKRLPKILKINRIEKNDLRISVLFSNGENRVLDFKEIFKKWKVSKDDVEYKLTSPEEFSKVKLDHYTLSWDNVSYSMKGFDGKKMKMPFQVGADTLFSLSMIDKKLEKFSLGEMLRKARISAKLSQEELAELSGTSRTYITKIENDKQDIEIMTLKKIIEAGLHKHLEILIR